MSEATDIIRSILGASAQDNALCHSLLEAYGRYGEEEWIALVVSSLVGDNLRLLKEVTRVSLAPVPVTFLLGKKTT